jgi:hypothetical protein
VEPFSVGPGGPWEKAFIGRSLVDEFRICGRPLSDEEVVRLYRQDSANVEMDAGLITVGEKTPVLDGRITDSEYAFAGAGFSDMKGFLARRQSRYLVSYDRTNLYVAVRSEMNADKAASRTDRDGNSASSERVEVFLDTASAPRATYHLVFTPSAGFYDERDGKRHWDCEGVRMESTVSDNIWTMEAAIAFSHLGLKGAPDGQNWRFNIGRVFSSPEAVTSVAPVKGSLDDRSQFLTLAFRPDAPFIRIASWWNLVKRQCAADVSAQCKNSRSEIRLDSISDNTKEYGFRADSVALFSQGKSAPYKSPVWTIQQDFCLSESRIVERLDGKETTLYLNRSVYEDQSPMKTLFLYTQAKKRLFVSALCRADGRIQARFLRPDGACAFRAIQDIPANSSYFDALFDLDFSRLTPGDYVVHIDYVAPDGKSTEIWEQAYRIPDKDAPEFRPYVDVDADKVPAPWTAVKSDGEKAEIWGRTYDFSKGFLFSSLVSQGREILAGPAALRMDGETLLPAQPTELKKVSGTDMLAEWEKRADLGKLRVESRIKTHFDGYCEIAMTLAPVADGQRIRSLSLDIPLRGGAATLVRDNRISTLCGGKSGAVGDYWCQDLFSGSGYFLWVGDGEVGFNWLAPDLENWNCKNTAKSVEILRQGDSCILRFNLVDTPLKLDGPRTIKFGFTLTPSRPLDRKILRMRNSKDLQMWCQPWQYFAYPDYETADRSVIEQASRQYGLNPKEVFLYFGDGLTSPFSPEWAWWEEEWRAFRGGARTYGEWTGDFRDPKTRARCCYVEAQGDTYFNFTQNRRHVFFERAKTPLTPKARNYYFDTGASTRDSYREQALNVYRMIRRTGPDAKIWGHQGWLRVMPMQHFTDIICGGEGVEGMLKKDGGYYNILTPEMFRATFSPQIWGVKMVFLYLGFYDDTEKNLNFDLKNPEDRRSVLHAYGYCLVHDVDIYNETWGPLASKLIQELMQPLWAAQDSLGWDEEIMFHPYWEQDAVKRVSPKSNRIMASAYTKNGKMLLAVLNDTDQTQDIRLEFSLEQLGIVAGAKGHDIWKPERTYVLGRNWEERIGPRGFCLLLWESTTQGKNP